MKCRVCDSNDLLPAIDLGMQPWCNNFLSQDQIGKEPFYPLRVVQCQKCHTAQLDYTVKKEVMFADHTYLSGVTRTLSDHFKNIAQSVDSIYFRDLKRKSVLDIGSNDGTQLKHFQTLGYDVVGVESSKGTADIANEAGIPTINAFFNEAVISEIRKKFDVINASGVFFHLEELHSVCRAIKTGLNPNGIFVVQFLYMKNIIENLAFDQIYHEHLLYYTLKTIQILLDRHELAMFDADLSKIHGGSIIGHITHKEAMRPKSNKLQELENAELQSCINDFKTYLKFADAVDVMKIENLKYLEKQRNEGKKIYGMGAPVKGNTLLNYFDIGVNLIDCLVEKNSLRRGTFSPGKHIPIVIEDELQDTPDVYYVLAWNFKTEILRNYSELIQNGVEFYFPVNPQ